MRNLKTSKAVLWKNRPLKTRALSTAAHYGGIVAVAGGVAVLGPPGWALGTGAVVAGVMTGASLWRERKTIKKDLVAYPATGGAFPGLGEIAEALHKKSGLKAKSVPLYGFRPPVAANGESKSVFGRLSAKVKGRGLKKALLNAHLPQATSLNLMGKPAIVVSEPLLKLLDEKETKAVLAHEFAHAAGRHHQLGASHSLISKGLVTVNRVMLRVAMLAAGTAGYAAMFAERALPRAVFGGSALWQRLLNKRKREQTLQQMKRRKNLNNILVVAGTVAATAAVAYISPVYIGIFAGLKGLSWAANLISSAYNRSLTYQADRDATKLGADPLALVTALRKVEAVKKGSIEKAYGTSLPAPGRLTKIWRRFNNARPQPETRIKKLAELAREQGVDEKKIAAAVSGPLRLKEENYLPADVVKQSLVKTVL